MGDFDRDAPISDEYTEAIQGTQTMSEKQIADRLREILWRGNNNSSIEALIHELDPPKPKPGTVVYFQQGDGAPWEIGMVTIDGAYDEDEPMVVTAYDGYTFEQLHAWRHAPIPDPDGYCVVGGRLQKLVEVAQTGTWGGGDCSWFKQIVTSHPGWRDEQRPDFMTREQVARKEQEYGLS